MNSASLRHFFDRSPELLATLTPDWKLRETNSAWLSRLGWSPDEIAGRPLESLLRGTGRHALEQALQADHPVETAVAHADGCYWNCSISLARVEGELCCTLRVVTPGEGYPGERLLASFIPHLVWLVARDGVPQYVDPHWRDFTGWQPEQPETRSWMTAVHPADHAETVEAWAGATSNGAPFQAQCRIRSSTGDYRWFLASALPLQPPQGSVRHWLGTCTDIHELRLTQEAREPQSQHLAGILESITDGFLTVDRSWYCTYMNQQAERLLQVRRDEVLGHRIFELFQTLGGSSERYLQRAMEQRELTEFEDFFKAAQLWIEVRAYPTPNGLAIYFRDSTAKRRMEERLREATQLETVGILAGGIAHDFNNLLTGIIGSASLAQTMLLDGDPVDHLLESIVLSGDRAAALTRQLLDYSGRGHLVIGKVNLSRMVAGMQTLLPTAAGKVETRLALAPDLPLVNADHAQVSQVLFNLVLNAAEAIGEAPDGCIEIRTFAIYLDEAWLSGHVLHGSLNPGPHVCLQVSDNGCGMERQILGRIFDPFFTTKFTGRGLGLAAAAGIIRSHHGAMLVESLPDRGTIFQIFFAAVV